MKNTRGEEFETLFHLVYLIVLSIFGILLTAVGLKAGGEEIVMTILIVMILLVWVAHIGQIGSPNQRIYFYTIVATLFLMYYGSHPTSISDMPLVLCLMLIVLSIKADMGLIYLIAISYPLMLAHHIFVTRYICLDMDWIVLARLALGLVCVGIAVLISRFFIHSTETDHKARLRLEEELDLAHKDSENLLTNVSHELRTPINAISGISELMLCGKLDPQIESQVRDIHLAGHRIYYQVATILDYAEIITSNVLVNPREYAIDELLDAIYSETMEAANPKGIKFVVDVANDIPKYLLGDSDKIYRVLMQLLGNAFKFTEFGCVELYVSQRAEEYGLNLNFDIYDTGIGMSKEEISHLFEGVYKADKGSRQMTGGLGIGFVVAYELTLAMNGFLTVESTPGEGTHVHVTIPQHISTPDASIYYDAYENTPLITEGLRVLVVDDEPMNLKVVRGILRTFDIEAKIAESGSEALALCELEDYDLIFMDYMMPEMDGEETMYRIRSVRNGYYRKTPIVALTANAASGARQMFLDMGFDEFLSKPVEVAEMQRMLKKMTGGEAHE